MPPVTHSLVKALRTVPDFEPLEEHDLLQIVGASANLFWPAGSIIFRAGQPAEALFVILSGEVRIFQTQDGREEEISRIGPDCSFGELSLLLHTSHTKDAQAVQDSEIMVIPEAYFERLMEENQEFAAHFRRRVQERMPLQGDVPGTT